MSAEQLTTRAEQLDAADPLASWRDEFDVPDRELAYLDGNSLGMPPRRTLARVTAMMRDGWAGELINGWEHWLELPQRVGDMLAPLIGAGPGEVVVHDSVTVNVYQLVRAALTMNPGRRAIAIDPGDFPTDRYVVEGIAAADGREVRHGFDQLDDVAVVLRSMIDYRTAEIVDIAAETARITAGGALVIWDLSHAAGVHPVGLRAAGAQLAVGCTYKFLNGGPGSPAFAYVASRHLEELTQPIQGWLGSVDPFLMGPSYAPAEGVRRFLSGTPPIVGMLALQDMLALLDEAGMDAVRTKSVALTSYAVDVADELLAPAGVVLASPRDPALRGGHVTLHHPLMREVTAALWERDVIPDYRDPGGLRIGLFPLSTSFEEVRRGLETVRETLDALTA